MIKTLSIGHASYDIYVQVEEFPKENVYERFVNKIGCGGGDASNVAYMLAKWGVSSTFAGTIGNDMYGNRIQKELESVGVDTRYIETTYDKDTNVSFTIVNTKTASSTLFNYCDEYVKLRKFDFDFQPDYIIVDGHDSYAAKSTIERFPKAITICDASRYAQEVIDSAKLCQYVVCTKDFAEKMTNIKVDFNNTATLVNLYDVLRKKLDHQNIVVTLSEHGALYQVDNQIKVSPALMVKAVDTTGAGDVFHGAFAYSLIKGWNVEQAVRFANIAAGLSTQVIGARTSIPKLQDVEKIYEEKAS
ncbi:MAG: hypothetical protein IJ572_01445 [Bacilli bacterium]|nr:hypothetical protein [Bacilli bacterium]